MQHSEPGELQEICATLPSIETLGCSIAVHGISASQSADRVELLSVSCATWKKRRLVASKNSNNRKKNITE